MSKDKASVILKLDVSTREIQLLSSPGSTKLNGLPFFHCLTYTADDDR